MSNLSQITINVESAPHTENLDGVTLNRPAPTGGSFLISARLDRRIWDKMKAVGAVYYSADDLEEFDMFQSEAGWRYSFAAIKVLLAEGYQLLVCSETVTTAAQLDALFSAQGQADYQAQRAAAKAEQERLAAQEAQRKLDEDDAKEAAYMAWKATHLAGLVQTFAGPRERPDWQKIAYFDGPGTWYTTGDSWSMAEIDGQKCYRCDYGNAAVCYAPQAIADQWIMATWDYYISDVYKGNATVAARSILEDSLHDYIGADIAKRLVELRGTDFFLKLATTTEWWVYGKDSLDWEGNAARHYGASPIYLEKLVKVEAYRYPAFLPGTDEQIQSYSRHPDGRVIAQGYRSSVAVVDPATLPQEIRSQLL